MRNEDLLKTLPILRERVIIEERTFLIERPEEPYRIPNHPSVRTTFTEGEYIPYWTDLWPASRMLAKAILREPWPPGAETLEVGCGLGLPGVAALARGLRVTFSDYDPAALEFAANNARINGFTDFRTLRLDWRDPPADLRVPVVLASDLIYELDNVEPLVGLIGHVLLPGGLCLLTDQDRVPSHALRETLTVQGFDYTTQIVRAGEPGGRRFKGTLYRIRKTMNDE
ncbi:MAG: protein N-lysine methyltransferase family protein [Gemmataceae bacterium]|nr:protein N-lysine methyltransferase family protein [Gemmataceae bacterium]